MPVGCLINSLQPRVQPPTGPSGCGSHNLESGLPTFLKHGLTLDTSLPRQWWLGFFYARTDVLVIREKTSSCPFSPGSNSYDGPPRPSGVDVSLENGLGFHSWSVLDRNPSTMSIIDGLGGPSYSASGWRHQLVYQTRRRPQRSRR